MTDRQRDDSADVVALLRLQSTYADIVTRRAWDELDTVFVPDISIEIDTVSGPVSRCASAAQFRSFVSEAVARFDHFQFVILNSVVDVEGDTARGRIFMCEIRHVRELDEWSTAYGLYQDSYACRAGRWWISERRYRSLARTGSAAGIFGVPDDLPPIGR